MKVFPYKRLERDLHATIYVNDEKINLTGYYDDNFFDNTFGSPKIMSFKDTVFVYQWTRKGVKVWT